MRDRKHDSDSRRRTAPKAERDDRPANRERSDLRYGVSPVLEALRAGRRTVERVLIAEGAREHRLQEIVELCRTRSITCERVSAEVFDRLTGAGQTHQGVVAICSAASYVSADEILDNAAKPELLLLLDGIEDPRNLGAVIRSAECTGVDGVFLPERRAVGLTEVVAKSSAGAVEHVRVAKVTNLNRLIDDLKQRNIWVVGTSLETSTAYYSWDWRQPSALVLGGEGSGLHRLVAENCDVLVKIPMYGRIDSLNVSVAAGVILSEARRQRAAGA